MLCDSHGRVYCGMLASNYFDSLKRGKYGSFWCWDQNEFTCLEDKIAPTPNGIRISPEGDRLYFAVTDADCIYVYDYDLETGALSNRRVFAEKCFPDGIAVDELGRVWVADCKPTGGVLCYDSTGKLLQKINFPVRRVISLAFGGADRKILFVTTANENQPIGQCDGGVFYIRTEHAGANEYRFPRIK